MNKTKKILSVSFLCCLFFFSSVINLEAKPITEATEKNQYLLNQYYQNYVDKEGYKIGLYLDIEPTDELFFKILSLNHFGVFSKHEKYFLPRKPVTAKEFIEIYLFVFKNKFLNLKIEDYYKLSAPEQLKFLTTQNKSFIPKSLLPIIEKINQKNIDYSLGLQAIEMLDEKLSRQKNLTRQDLVNSFYSKLEKEKLLAEVLKKTFDYERPLFNKNKLPEIKLDQNYIYVDGKKLKGLFINWMDVHTIKHETIKIDEIERMKKLNIVGITLEIGWDEIENEQGKLIFPSYFDKTLNLLASNGLYVHVLLSPHYTPDWVFRKYKKDIRMVDIHGKPQAEGEYATFSYESPAVEDQIKFQQAATKYYSNFPNVVTILLGNEQSYGRMHDLDYSNWVDQAWKVWLDKINVEITDLPKDPKDEYLPLFKRFRQISLNNYFNRVYEAVKPVQKRVPLSFKFIPYENTSAFSPKYGLHLSPLEIKTDFMAIDIYGHTSNVYGLINAFNMPKVIIETNLPGNWSENQMTKYLLINYLRGVPLQSIFAWFKSDYENSLLLPDGTYWHKTYALHTFSKIIRAIDEPIIEKSKIAIIIPSNGLNLEGHLYFKYQYPLDDLIDKIYTKTGNFPTLLWSDDVFLNRTNKNELMWDKEKLEDFKEIILFPSVYDQSRRMKNDINTIIYFSPEKYIEMNP